jgi:hypothetical protein
VPVTDELARRELLKAVPAPSLELRDWNDVVRRARRTSRRYPGGRLAITLAAVVAAATVVVATPLGAAIARSIGDFTAWLSGQPGEIAAPADQSRFTRASKRSWIAFPRTPQLRQLLDARRDGSRYVLFGYRTGESFCLRLVVSGAARGSANQCAPLAELRTSRAPALVLVADAGFGSVPRRRVRIAAETFVPARALVTAGVVAYGVRSVEMATTYRRIEGVVGGNAFLAVDVRPRFDSRTRKVTVVSEHGTRASVPFAPVPFRDWDARPPTRPPLGPARIERRIRGGEVGWLTRGEHRGIAAPRSLTGFLGRGVESARLLDPDRSGLRKVLVTRRRVKDGVRVCAMLATRAGSGGGCALEGHLFDRGPFNASYGFMGAGSQYVTVAGIASDDVARMRLYLATGEQIDVPLGNNAFVVPAARAKYPIRLVAFDSQGHVIGVETSRSDGFVARGPHPAPSARWRLLLRTTSFTGRKATIWTTAAEGGGTCWQVGTPSSISLQCMPRRWTGPALRLGIQNFRLSAFLTGRVRPDVSEVDVRFRDGQTIRYTPTRGFVLAVLPRRHVRDGHRALELIGRDVRGRVVGKTALQRLPVRLG